MNQVKAEEFHTGVWTDMDLFYEQIKQKIELVNSMNNFRTYGAHASKIYRFWLKSGLNTFFQIFGKVTKLLTRLTDDKHVN